jgi:hypothetical protein
MIEAQNGTLTIIQRLEPSFELDEFDVSVIVLHIDPHPEMKNVAMGITQKRYVIFISCS